MNKLLTYALGLGLAFSGLASAGTLTEPFNNPFPDWELGWFGQNSTATNYYGVGQGRGNNPTGLWINDTTPGDQDILVQFNPGFAATLTSLFMDVSVFAGNTRLRFFDASGTTLSDLGITPGNFGVTSGSGIGGFEFYNSGVEGNTAVDNVTVTFSDTPEPESFGLMLLGATALLIRRRARCS